jgi:hypothetical protein
MHRERDSSNTEDRRCLFGLVLTHTSNGMTRRFTVTEVDKQHGPPAAS